MINVTMWFTNFEPYQSRVSEVLSIAAVFSIVTHEQLHRQQKQHTISTLILWITVNPLGNNIQ